MNLLEKIYEGIERGHRWLSATCLRIATRLWHWQGNRKLTLRFAVGFAGLTCLSLWCAHQTGGAYVAARGFDGALVRYLERAGHLVMGERISLACGIAAALCALATFVSAFSRPIFFRILQIAWAAFAATAVYAFFWIMNVGPILVAADHKAFDSSTRNELWTGVLFWSLAAAVWAGALLLALIQKRARGAYGLSVEPFTKDFGPRTVEGLKTTKGDRRWKSSLYYACTIFFFLLFGPYLFFMWGWEDPYTLPKGGGEQAVEVVTVKRKPKKKPKKLTVNPWSPYILERMNIDDVETVKDLEEETRDTYVAQNSAKSGRKGGKGKGVGGWPEGMEGSAIRFIRLKYAGGDWDQDMGKGADYNLLLKFHEWTGMKIAKETEFREIERLKFFPKKKAPPFVFMTGMRGITLSEKEVSALRNYCLNEGGMLFIDNGGGHFDYAVRSMLRRVFPGRPLVDIPNDDLIYQQPYVFPDGAPPFWHHAGYRAMGVRDESRWVVFYHPGDVNDAWKDDHSGASAEVADQAYKLGVNIMFYAFTQYCRRHYE